MDALRCQTGILKNETVSENRSQPVTGSERAVEVNIAIMRTFVQLRRLMDSNRDLAQKIGEMEEKYDGQFRIVFDAIRQLMTPPAKPSRELGFHIIQPPKPVKKPTRSPRKS